jgi:hypothetical protein
MLRRLLAVKIKPRYLKAAYEERSLTAQAQMRVKRLYGYESLPVSAAIHLTDAPCTWLIGGFAEG